MKALGKLLGDFVAWRWAPAVGLCVASLFYVLVVVALVPDEIGVPVTDARFAKKRAPATDETPELPTFPTAMPETESAPPPMTQVRPAGVVDFGRRGFSPPLERPDSPPEPPPVVMPPPPVPVPPPVAEAPPPAEAPPAVAASEPAAVASAAPAPPSVAGGPGVMRAFRSFPRGIVQNPSGQQPPGAQPQPPGAQPQPPGDAPAAPTEPPAQ